MESREIKYIKLVAKLNEVTQKRDILWRKHPYPENLNLGSDKKVKLIFDTQYKAKNLRIYEEDHKNYYDFDQWVWDSQIVLAIIDVLDNELWRSPQVEGLYDLWESVKLQESGVDEFINSVLNDGRNDEDELAKEIPF